MTLENRKDAYEEGPRWVVARSALGDGPGLGGWVTDV